MNKIVLYIIYVSFYFLNPIGLKAQSLDEILHDIISIKHENKIDMPSYFPKSIYKDSQGFVWMGLRNSLIRYDGVSHEEYFFHPLLNPGMLMTGPEIITEDHLGNIWIGSWSHGLSKYEPLNGSFTKFNASDHDSTSIHDNRISAIEVDEKGRVWVSTVGNVLHLYNETDNSFDKYFCKKLPKIKDIHFGKMDYDIIEDKLWIGSKLGVISFDIGAKKFNFFPIDKIVPNHYNFWPSPVYLDQDQKLWFGHYNREGIKIFDVKTKSWTHKITIENEHDLRLGATRIIDIFPFRDSLILGASWFNHLYLINRNNPEDYSILPYTDTNENCLGFFVDDADAIWLGLEDILLSLDRKKKNAFRTFYYGDFIGYDGKGNFQREFIHDPEKKAYYIGTGAGDGLLELKDDFSNLKVHRYKSSYGKYNIDVTINGIILDEERIWMSTFDELLIKEGQSPIGSYSGKPEFYRATKGKNFLKLYKEDDGFWITYSNGGMSFFNNKEERFRKFDDNSLMVLCEEYLIHKVERLSGDTYLLATDKGLVNYDLSQNAIVKDWCDSISYKKLEEFQVLDFVVNNDTVWVATSGNGLAKCIKNLDTTFDVDFKLSTENFGSNIINRILLTKEQEIWLATNYGFSHYNRDTELFDNFGMDDGLDFAPRSGVFAQLISGEIISGSNGGFDYFVGEELLGNSELVTPYLKSISVDESARYYDPVIHSHSITLKAEEDHILFEMGGINFNKNSSNYYKFILDNYDEDWSKGSKNSIASYTNLPGGDYIFKFMAAGKPEAWNHWNIEIPIHVETPFFESRLFYFILLCMASFLTWVSFRLLDIRKKEKQLILEKEAELIRIEKERIEAELTSLRTQMNPHFLFNSLNSVKWFILKRKPEEASRYLSKFSKLIRQILDLSRSKLISLQQELDCLRLYVELESMRFENPFEFDIKIDPEISLSKTQVPPLIIQPFVENAIWHGLFKKKGSTALKIELIKEFPNLRVIIDDNGVGRNFDLDMKEEKSNKSHGLDITRMRLKNHGIPESKSIVIEDKMDEQYLSLGTKVTITLPWINGNS